MIKKFLSIFILIILVISQVTIVYADLIMPGRFFEYKGVEKFGGFIKTVGSPLIEIIAIMLILFIIIGLVLITLKKVEEKEYKSSKVILRLKKIFVGISIILDLLSIYILKMSLLFSSTFGGGSTLDKSMRASSIDTFILILYAIYAISIIICIKKKNEKVLSIITTGLITVLFIISGFVVFTSNAGYYAGGY